MAVPTITGVTPNTGLTRGGEWVTITGTNFRAVPAPAATGYVGGPEQFTVAVAFDGVAAPYAAQVDATTIKARVPAYTGTYQTKVGGGGSGEQVVEDALPVTVDVRVANLDDTGAEIVGENATLAGGYTYTRASLTQQTMMERVIAAAIETLRRHVTRNVWWTKYRDYDDTPDDLLDQLQRTGSPLLRMSGPLLTEDLDHGLVEAPYEEDPSDSTKWLRRVRQRTASLGFTVEAFSTAAHPGELLNLAQAFVACVDGLPWLEVERDDAHPGTGAYRLEWFVPPDGFPAFDMDPNLPGTQSWRADIEISGVDLGDEELAVVARGTEAPTQTVTADGDL